MFTKTNISTYVVYKALNQTIFSYGSNFETWGVAEVILLAKNVRNRPSNSV